MMQKTMAVYKRELKSFFYSPVGYIVLGLFVILTGVFFYIYLSEFVQNSLLDTMRARQYRMAPRTWNVNFQMIRPFLYNVSMISLFILPLVTMRLFSEEKRMGTVELLYTTPITINNIVIGKFLAGLTYYAIMLLAPLFYLFLLYFYGSPELAPILTGFLGLLLMGAVMVSFGLFISTLTENQIVAAAGTFVVSLLLWLIGWAASYAGPVLGAALRYMTLTLHFEDFAQGIIDTQHIMFYLLFTFLGVYLAKFSLESVKWRM